MDMQHDTQYDVQHDTQPTTQQKTLQRDLGPRRKKKKEPAVVAPVVHERTASAMRISRIKGQVDAVSRMLAEKQYCPEIIQQIRAATNALKSLEREVLKGHLHGCVRSAMESKDPYMVRDKVDEIVKLWG